MDGRTADGRTDSGQTDGRMADRRTDGRTADGHTDCQRYCIEWRCVGKIWDATNKDKISIENSLARSDQLHNSSDLGSLSWPAGGGGSQRKHSTRSSLSSYNARASDLFD